MEVQLWEDRLDRASKNKWGEKKAMPIHLWQEQSVFKWLKTSASFLWGNSKLWEIHIRRPQFSQVSRQMTAGDRVRIEKNAETVAAGIYNSIVFKIKFRDNY